MSEVKVPFLLCLPREKLGTVMVQLDAYQHRHHGVRFEKPFYIESDEPDIINAPLSSEEVEIEAAREMSRPPKHQRKVE